MRTKDEVQEKFLKDAISSNEDIKSFAQNASKKFTSKECTDLIDDFISNIKDSIFNNVHKKMEDEYKDESDSVKRIDLTIDSPLFNRMKYMVERYKDSTGMILDSMINVTSELSDPYMVGLIYGGRNGQGNWVSYLEKLKELFTSLSSLGEVWIIKLENDVIDDRFTLTFGYRERGV